MALINCPECTKEISDKVKNCPHCGFPMEEDNPTQKVELSSISIKVDEKQKKKITTLIIVAVVSIMVLFGGYSIYKAVKNNIISKNYRTNVEILTFEMVASGAEAEDLMNLTTEIWYNSIYQQSSPNTDKYTMLNGYFLDDFNVALDRFFDDNDTQIKISAINSSRIVIDDIIKTLQNPPDEYLKLYDTIMDLYSSYQGVTELAINPQGSLQTFNDGKIEKIEKFMELYKKVQTQLY